jgi:hypothetical protein
MTPELIKLHIANIPNMSDDELVHHQKCCTSSDHAKKLKAYAKAIEKERRARGRIKLVEDVTPLDEQQAEAEAHEAYLKGE